MGLTLLLEGLSVATSVGLGCGTCCGTSAGILLSGYVMTHARDSKQSMLALLAFFLGKAAGVAALCLVASIVGQAAFLEGDLFSQGWAKRAFDVFVVGMGLWFLYGWYQEMRGKRTCGKQCQDHHKMRQAAEAGVRMPALFVAGAGYGITPCAPLVVVAGLCVTLPVGYALVTGAAFAFASIASPLLLVLVLSGVLTTHMHREIPGMIRWLRLACYLGMVAFFLVDLVQTF
ncbi:MAG: sulfite exporter TauE/SafE family protein [Coriobacteriales bacterium]|nr:sulfite exporter TauE/SafE family protein [Coriobacteriales bacterium]